MLRNLSVIIAAVVVVALPLALRRDRLPAAGAAGPALIVISPHNEAIRYEFGSAFSRWHQRQYGTPARVEWRVIGGSAEIMRYLAAAFTSSFRAWWKAAGRAWPDGGGEMILDGRFRPERGPDPATQADAGAMRRWSAKAALHRAFRATDDAAAFGSGIDVLFGGGTYDHGKLFRDGLIVPAWPAGGEPPGLLADAAGNALIPAGLGGETWRDQGFIGATLSTFGICYNTDRLRDLGVRAPPAGWRDLADPVYFRQVGLCDPTKSGSIAKAFEMIIHAECHAAVAAAGYDVGQVAAFEQAIAAAGWDAPLPAAVPPGYQQAVEAGWHDGLHLVQRIAANARYFTDSASKVPVDVGMGNAAAGVAIDFYGRFQAEIARQPDGRCPLVYVTPVGGSSVSADPISLLRGAPHPELARRFMGFVLGEEGQKLWNYRPGTAGGPVRYALRRLPIRRDFYPCAEVPAFAEAAGRHAAASVDPLGDESVNPYALAGRFVYYPRWTARHFNVQRDLIRAMCLDAGDELRAAWAAIIDHGGPAANPAAMAALRRLPDRPAPLTWASALNTGTGGDRLDCLREWTLFYRARYRQAAALAVGGGGRD